MKGLHPFLDKEQEAADSEINFRFSRFSLIFMILENDKVCNMFHEHSLSRQGQA